MCSAMHLDVHGILFLTYDTNEAACILNFLYSKTFPRTLATNNSPMVKLSIKMPIVYSYPKFCF